MHDDERRAGVGDFGDCRDDRVHPRRILEQLAAELEDYRRCHSSPVVSSMPSTAFMFCTACPDAPFSRLSMTDTTTARPEESTRQPMSQKFVWATCLISGNAAPVSRMNGSLPNVRS